MVQPQPIPDLSHGDDPMIGMSCVIGYMFLPILFTIVSSVFFFFAWIIKFKRIFTRKFIMFFLISIILIFLANDLNSFKENNKYIKENEIRRKERELKNPEKEEEAKCREEIRTVRTECDYLKEDGSYYDLIFTGII